MTIQSDLKIRLAGYKRIGIDTMNHDLRHCGLGLDRTNYSRESIGDYCSSSTPCFEPCFCTYILLPPSYGIRILGQKDRIGHQYSRTIQKVPRKSVAVHDFVHPSVYLRLVADVQVENVVVLVLLRPGFRYPLSFDQDTFVRKIIM